MIQYQRTIFLILWCTAFISHNAMWAISGVAGVIIWLALNINNEELAVEFNDEDYV